MRRRGADAIEIIVPEAVRAEALTGRVYVMVTPRSDREPRLLIGRTGEPFEQPLALLALARGLRQRTTLSLLVFSGFTLEQIRCRPLGRRQSEPPVGAPRHPLGARIRRLRSLPRRSG